MMHRTFPHRRESLKEHRLLSESVERPKNQPMTLDQLKAVLEAAQTPDQQKMLAESLKQLDPSEVSRNLDALATEASTKAESKDLQLAIENVKKNMEPPVEYREPPVGLPKPGPLPEEPRPDLPYTETPPTTEQPEAKKEEPPKNFVEWVGKTAKDIKTDFVEGNGWTKAGYIAGGVVGFLAARWLWRKAFGDGTNEGWVAKTGKWLLSLGAAAAGVLGVKAAMDWWNNKPSSILPPGIIPPVPKETADAARDVTQGAISELSTTAGKTAEVAGKTVEYVTHLFQQEDISEGMKYAVTNGIPLAWDGIGLTMHIAGRAIALPLVSAEKLGKWLLTGNKDQDIWLVYGQSGVAYLVGQKLFNLVMRGQVKTLIPLTKKDIALTVLKVASGPFGAAKDALALGSTAVVKDGARALQIRYIKQSAIGAGVDALRRVQLLRKPDEILKAIKEWQVMNSDCDIMKKFSNRKLRLFSETEVLHAIENKKLFGLEIKKIIQKMDITEDMPEVLRKLKLMSNTNMETFDEELNKAWSEYLESSKTGTAKVVVPESSSIELPKDAELKPLPDEIPAKQATSTADTVGESKPAPITKTGKVSPEKVSPAADQIGSLLKDRRMTGALKKAGPNAAQMELKIVEQLSEMDSKVVDLITKSRGAKKLLAEAIATGKEIEVDRILKAARLSQNLRVIANGVGVVGDAFGLVMVYADWQASNQKIAATDNAALKEIYGNAYALYAGEGVASASGLVIGGASIYAAAGGTNAVIVGIGTTAGFVVLPIAGAVMAARQTYLTTEESAEYHTLREKDLIKEHSPGDILNHVGKSAPLSNLNWGQEYAIPLWKPFDYALHGENSHVDFDKANEMARITGYRAYFMQIAAACLPEANPTLDLDADVKASLLAQEKNGVKGPKGESLMDMQLKSVRGDWISKFALDAETYIAYKTENKYQLVSPDILRNAVLYAEMQFERKAQDQEAPVMPYSDKNYWVATEQDILKRDQKEKESSYLCIQDCVKTPERFAQEMPVYVFNLLREELSDCERRILATDYSNWGSVNAWTSLSGDDYMRQVARGLMALDLRWELSKTVQGAMNKKEISKETIETLIQTLKMIMHRNLDEIAMTGIKLQNAAKYAEIGSSSQRLSVPGMIDLLKNIPLLKKAA